MKYKEVEGIDEQGNPTTFKLEIPTGLEALQELRKLSNNQCWIGQRFAISHLDIIEKELNDYEKLQEEYKDFESIHEEIARHYNALYKERLLWLKEHRALEIIKEKRVDVSALLHIIEIDENDEQRLEDYNDECHGEMEIALGMKELTQDEYYSLKEVLL